MALAFAHGSLSWLTTDVATTVYTISGLSFQPKALRFFMVGLDSAVDATSDAVHWEMCSGFATGTADRRSVLSYSGDALASAGCATGYRTDCVLFQAQEGATLQAALDLNSITSDGFTLIVDDAAARSVRIFWQAWGGADITNAVTGEIAEPAATGVVDYTVTGSFQPDVVLFEGSKATGAAQTIEAIDNGMCVGAATGAAQQWVFSANQDDGSPSADTDRYGRSDECLATHTEAGGDVNARATFVQFNADGFRLNWLARATTNRKTIYLAIKGGQWRAGTYTINATTAGNTATVTGLPFQPVGCLQCTHGFSEQAAGGSTTFATISFGSFISTTDRMGIGVIDEDAPTNMEIDTAIEYDQVWVFPNVSGAPPGVLKSVDVTAVNSDGFTMTVDVGGSVSTDLVGYLAFASAAAGPTLIAAADAAAVQIVEAAALSVTVTVAESAALRVSEAVALAATVATSDALAIVLTEAAAALATIEAQESVAVRESSAASLTAQVPASEAVAVVVAEATALDVVVAVADALGVRVADAMAILATLMASETVAVIIGTETADISITEAGLVSIAASDTLMVVLAVEAATLRATLSAAESAAVATSEGAALHVALEAAASLPTRLVEAGAVAILVTAQDAASVRASEAGVVAVHVSAAEAARVGLTEAVALFAELALTDLVVLVPSEAVGLAVTLAAADSPRLQVDERAVPLVSLAALDAVGIRIADVAALLEQMVASDSILVAVSEAAEKEELDTGVDPAGSVGGAGWSRRDLVHPRKFIIRRRFS